MSNDKVILGIDLNKDFDGIDLENTIDQIRSLREKYEDEYGLEIADKILTRIHHKWVVQIGHPEWSKELK